MKLEIPCKLYDEIVPRRYVDELERVAADWRKKLYLNYQLKIPISLEKLQAHIRMQSSGQKKIMSYLKAINLYKFDTQVAAEKLQQ